MFRRIPAMVLAAVAVYATQGLGTAEAQFQAAQEPPTTPVRAAAGKTTLMETRAARREADEARRQALRNEFLGRKQSAGQPSSGNLHGIRPDHAVLLTNDGLTRNPLLEDNFLPPPAPGPAAGTFGRGAPFDSFRVYPNSFPIPYQGQGTPGTQFLAPNPMFVPSFRRTYSNAPARVESKNPMYMPAFGRTYSNRP